MYYTYVGPHPLERRWGAGAGERLGAAALRQSPAPRHARRTLAHAPRALRRRPLTRRERRATPRAPPPPPARRRRCAAAARGTYITRASEQLPASPLLILAIFVSDASLSLERSLDVRIEYFILIAQIFLSFMVRWLLKLYYT